MSVHIVMMLVPSMFIDLVEFYGLTKASLGLIFSISSFCYGLGSLPMSLLYNKYYTYNNMNYSNNTHLI